VIKKFLTPPIFVFVILSLLGIVLSPSCRKPVVDASADTNTNPRSPFSESISLMSVTTGASRVITLAGSNAGFVNATGTAAKFTSPGSIAIDAFGNVYVADRDNNMIRKIASDGVVTTFAGNTTPGLTDGVGSAASFRTPTGVAVDAAGNVYVADSGNNVIRKIVPTDDGTGEVTILAGSPTGQAGFTDETPAASAQFNGPAGIAVDASGTNVYVTDVLNVRIRKISEGFVNTLAGNGQTGNNPDPSPIPGRVASFNAPAGLAVDKTGNVLLADRGNNRIRKISPAGVVSPAAGDLNGTAGNIDGSATLARFNAPAGVVVDASSGNVYVADMGNNQLRTITPAGNVSIFAGSTEGSADGNTSFAKFKSPGGIAMDAIGNVYVADQGNHRIREITYTVSVLAGNQTAGFINATGTLARFSNPTGVAADASGNIYVADCYNHRIRKITPAGAVSTFAGNANPGSANGIGAAAQFKYPTGIAIDASNNVYVADASNHCIRKITPAREVSTLAGNGISGFADGAATDAQFKTPTSLTVDATGNVYVADSYNNRIRKISQVAGGTYEVSTVAGDGTAGLVEGPGPTARFNLPEGIAIDASGNIYVGDRGNVRVRKITPAGDVSTLAGSSNWTFTDGPASIARFATPCGVSVDAAGNVYVADYGNNRIRKINPSANGTGVVGTLAGNYGWGLVNGPAPLAQFHFPFGIAIDATGTLYVADAGNNCIRKIQ
jgi:DNA-binding beta-propeller fold protein YncE